VVEGGGDLALSQAGGDWLRVCCTLYCCTDGQTDALFHVTRRCYVATDDSSLSAASNAEKQLSYHG